jgi:hypothetical protein
MHKAQIMSQRRITLPLTLEFRAFPAHLVAVSRNAYLPEPESAPHRYIRKEYRELDPWDLRDAFLTWPPKDWKNFLSWAGSFSALHPAYLNQKEFTEWQELLREALKLHPKKWQQLYKHFDSRKVDKFLAPLPIEFEWNEETPQTRIATMRSLDAIIAAIHLDFLQGAQFRSCAREDCSSPPFRADDPRKKYCSHECGHLVAVRESRKAERKKAKRKRGKA